MSIARSQIDLVGSLSSPHSLSAGATYSPTPTDVLGDQTSEGYIEIWCKIESVTGSSTAPTNFTATSNGDISGSAGSDLYTGLAPFASITPTTSYQFFRLGTFTLNRFFGVSVDNTDGTYSVNVYVYGEVVKVS